jgi:two-component system response regulator YesN
MRDLLGGIMGIRTNNFLIRLIVFCLLLGTVPIVTLGILSYYRSSAIVQEKVTEGNSMIIKQTQQRVEQLLRTVENMTTQFIGQPSIVAAVRMPLNADRFQQVSEISRGLVYLQSFELGISDVVLWSIQQDWLMQNNGLYAFREYKDSGRMLLYASYQKSSQWVKGHDAGTSEEPANDTINLVKKIPVNFFKPTGLIVIKIPAYHIRTLLLQNSKLGKMIIFDENYQVIAQDGGLTGNPGSAFAEIVNSMSKLSNNEGDLELRWNGVESIATYLRSPYNGWIYVSIVSIEDITQESKGIAWITLFTCISVLLVILIIAVLGSRKMYKPLGVLSDFVRNTLDKPSAGERVEGDEFTMISEHIHSLTAKQSSMADLMTGQLVQMKELFTIKLIQGSLSGSELSDKINMFPHVRAWNHMALFTLQIDTLEGTRYEERDRFLLMFAINNIVSELIPETERLCPIIHHNSQVTVVGSSEESAEYFKQHLYKLVESIQAAVYQYLDLVVSIGISRTYTEWQLTGHALKEALEALKYRMSLGHKIILFLEDIEPIYRSGIPYPVEHEADLIVAVRHADQERAQAILHLIVTELFKVSMNPGSYQVSLARLLMSLITVLQETEDAQSMIVVKQKSALFEQMFLLKNMQEIEAWFLHELVNPLVQLHEEKRDVHFKRISDSVIQMIHDCFQEDLTLEICASRLNFHPVYISRVFAKEAGIHFGEYLAQYRLNVAKQWLTSTDMRIADIAEKLRYHNSQNFIRYFRKVMGMTPGQYRESNRAKM